MLKQEHITLFKHSKVTQLAALTNTLVHVVFGPLNVWGIEKETKTINLHKSENETSTYF